VLGPGEVLPVLWGEVAVNYPRIRGRWEGVLLALLRGRFRYAWHRIIRNVRGVRVVHKDGRVTWER
jgi:hypothetical protein